MLFVLNKLILFSISLETGSVVRKIKLVLPKSRWREIPFQWWCIKNVTILEMYEIWAPDEMSDDQALDFNCRYRGKQKAIFFFGFSRLLNK